MGDQIDSCATNYRLCADPISYIDRRQKRPIDYCEALGIDNDLSAAPAASSAPAASATSAIDPSPASTDNAATSPASPASPAAAAPKTAVNASNASTALSTTTTSGGTSSGASSASAASQCRDDTFCTWDCFSSSLFVSQCESSGSGGQASYAKSGQLCASVDQVKAVCEEDDCMSLTAQTGFYKLTVDINCSRSGRNEPCNLAPDGVGVDWNRPASAARAMGKNTEGNVPRCPKERWMPLLENDPAYTKQVQLMCLIGCSGGVTWAV